VNLPAGGHDTTDPHVLCEAPPIEHSKPHRPNKLCKILTYWRWRGLRRQYALGAAGITISISFCIQREAYTQVVRIRLFHRSGTTSATGPSAPFPCASGRDRAHGETVRSGHYRPDRTVSPCALSRPDAQGNGAEGPVARSGPGSMEKSYADDLGVGLPLNAQ